MSEAVKAEPQDNNAQDELAQPAKPLQKRLKTGRNVSRDVIAGAESEARAINARLTALLEAHDLGRDRERQKKWIEKLAAIETKAQEPVRSIIAVTGGTGSGKSALINALLESSNLVPTSCARACTAVITEISYHDEPGIRAQVDFLDPAEWEKELTELQEDLRDQARDNHWDDPNTVSGIAWSKINRVYPELHMRKVEGDQQDEDYFPDVWVDTLLETAAVKNHLGKSVSIQAADSEEFAQKIRKYVDSRGGDGDEEDEEDEEPSAQEYWPLIKKVRIFVKAEVLSSGAVLVDLPGGGDSNAARSAMASQYLQRADAVYIVADQTRAVDDKTSKDLLSDSLAQQLSMDDKLSAITFVVTKSDIIIPTEILRDRRIARTADCREVNEQIKALKKRLASLKKDQKQAQEDCDAIIRRRAGAMQGDMPTEPLVPALGAKRKNTQDSSKSHKRARSVVEHSNNAVYSDSQDESAEDLSATLAEAEKRHSVLILATNYVLNDLTELETRKRQKCALARNQWSKDSLSKQFDTRFAIHLQNRRETADPEGFDPNDHDGQSDLELPKIPIFCVSSAEYMRMKSRTTESNLTKTFDDIVNTEIPSLQEHTIASTAELELAQAETCLTELSDLCLQITTHLAHTACPADEAEAVKAAFFTEKEACKQLIVSFLAGVTSRFEDTVKNDLEAKLEGGVAEAQRLALDTATAAAASLHHSSWKAVVRRDGVYEKKNVDLNQTLCSPIIKGMAPYWDTLFVNPSVVEGYTDLITEALQRLQNAIKSQSQSIGEGERGQAAAKSASAASKSQNRQVLKRVATAVASTKADAWRQLAPSVKDELLDSYKAAAQEGGKGSTLRSRQHVYDTVAPPDGTPTQTYCKATTEVIKRLGAIPVTIAEILEQGFRTALAMIEDNFEALWDPTEIDKDKQSTARRIKLIADIEAEQQSASAIQEALLKGDDIQVDQLGGMQSIADEAQVGGDAMYPL